MKTTLFLDGNFLGHRARHTTGGLSHEGMPTGVLYAFIRDLEIMTELHGASRVVFAFDTGGSLRKQLSSQYKSSRVREYTEEEQAALNSFFEEMKRLRTEILPDLGYRNIWRQKGYEADDLIAAGCLALPEDEEGVIVTADNDLWQCINARVRWWNPITKRTVTAESFSSEWKIAPSLWAKVKAIAGCSSDDVVGVAGVGEKTAVKWLRGELKPDSVKYKAIYEARSIILGKNLKLVRLPFEGLEIPDLLDDEVTEPKRMQVYQRLGIRSTRRSIPAGTKIVPARKGFL